MAIYIQMYLQELEVLAVWKSMRMMLKDLYVIFVRIIET